LVLTLKVWAVFFSFVILGQLRPGQGGTLEQRFHSYLNQTAPQKFFVGLLSPVHTLMSLVGLEVDEASIKAIQQASDSPQEAPVSPFVSPEGMKNLKKSLKERQRVLKESDSTP
jgi:hypothetical protein